MAFECLYQNRNKNKKKTPDGSEHRFIHSSILFNADIKSNALGGLSKQGIKSVSTSAIVPISWHKKRAELS